MIDLFDDPSLFTHSWSKGQIYLAILAVVSAFGLVLIGSYSAQADTGTTSLTPEAFHASRNFADTPFGRIAYVERGEGPVALFIHGALLNGYQWRHQLGELSDIL